MLYRAHAIVPIALFLVSPLIADDTATTEIPVTKIEAVAEDSTDAFRLSLHWENDGTVLKPDGDTDRYYTNGAGFTLALRNQFAVDATNWIPFGDSFDRQRRAVGFTAGQLIFTPENISIDPPDPTDRPYAGYLYAGFFFQRANDYTLDHLELNIGIIGNSALAESVQVGIHDLSGAPDPLGWDNQLENELAIQLFLRKTWRCDLGEAKLNDIPAIEFQLLPEAEIAIGTVYRHAKVSAMLRAGFHLPDDFGPDQLLHIGSFTSIDPPSPWSGYVFAKVAGKALEHNLFLEGNTYKNSAGVDEEPLVGEAQLGIALHFQCGGFSFDVTYSQIFLTKEFDHQNGHHGYGTLSAAMVWRF